MNIAKIISDGLPNGTRIILEDGSHLSGVTHVEWSLNAKDTCAEIKVTISAHSIEMDVEGKISIGTGSD